MVTETTTPAPRHTAVAEATTEHLEPKWLRILLVLVLALALALILVLALALALEA